MPRRFRAVVRACAMTACLAAAVAARAGDPDRGRYLYELKCGSCHSESVHSRDHRKAESEAEVREWVRRWSDYLQLGFGEEEIEDVVAYLNLAFYRFCDPPRCRVAATHAKP